jgi:hypothetical protein
VPLLAQVAGVVLAGVLVAVLLHGRLSRPGVLSGLAIAVAALMTVVAAGTLQATAATLGEQREAYADMPTDLAKQDCVPLTGGDGRFLTFVQGNIPRGESYAFIASQEFFGRLTHLCYALNLFPRMGMTDPEDADWLIYSGAEPEPAEVRRLGDRVNRFGEGQLVVRVR